MTDRLYRDNMNEFAKLYDQWCNQAPDAYPSCLHTTAADTCCQFSLLSAHTVPHKPFRQTSSRPSVLIFPPASLNSPSVQLLAAWREIDIVM